MNIIPTSMLISAALVCACGCAAPANRAHDTEAGQAEPDRPGPDHQSASVIALEPDSYGLAFSAARDVLMDYRFAIDRVDARRGVITTHPKRSAGLATIWDREQSSMRQEWEDLINEQRRVVRVEFEMGERGATAMRVLVEVLRTHRPGWRVQTESVRLSEHARIRSADGSLEPGSYREPVGQDTALSARLASAIEERVRSAAGEP